MSGGRWSGYADEVLAELFVPGQPAPTRAQLRDAYPFTERAYWPYKAWLARVKAWRAAHARGMAHPPPSAPPRRSTRRDDGATGDLFNG